MLFIRLDLGIFMQYLQKIISYMLNGAYILVFKHGNWSVILRLESIQRRVTKIIKRVKDYSYRERLEKLGLTT